MCEAAVIDGSTYDHGIITSPNYPLWTSNQDCKQIIVAPAGKMIKVFMTDLNMDAPDQNNK
jgi:hypothetical protein